jgi:hypothetical protein
MKGVKKMDQNTRIGMEVSLAIGCPVRCDYCPQDLIKSVYQGARYFTLDSYKQTLEVGQVPITVNQTYMGACDPYICKDATKIMRWALQERGHMGSVSTILQYCSYEDIDALAEMKDRLTDCVIHCPADDNRMPGLRVDSEYVEKFKYVIRVLRNNPGFVLQVYNTNPHAAIHKIWADSGIHIPRYGLHDRAGHLPNLQGPYVKHVTHPFPIQICGKLFGGHIYPNSDLGCCCNEWNMERIWGNLLVNTHYELYHSQKFKDYVKSLQGPNTTPRCARCSDSFHQINPEDRNKGYDLIGH